MALKLPRTIRLDPSDSFVYSRAAEPGEWAVTGTFLFFGADVENLSGKERHVHPPLPGHPGVYGPCPRHPDAPGDL